MPLTYQSSNDRLKNDEQMLAIHQEALVDVLKLGQSHTINGSRALVLAQLEQLNKDLRMYDKRVKMAKGHVPRNVADFSGGGADVPES